MSEVVIFDASRFVITSQILTWSIRQGDKEKRLTERGEKSVERREIERAKRDRGDYEVRRREMEKVEESWRE